MFGNVYERLFLQYLLQMNLVLIRWLNSYQKFSTMTKYLIATLVSLFLFSVSVKAQKKTEEIKIRTSAQCEMCKTRIETAMAYEKGVTNSNLNLEDKVLTVTYKPGKTSPDKIRKALNELGYDADETLAVESAYQKLPPCCKKPDDPEHVGH